VPVELSTPKPPDLRQRHGPMLILAVGLCAATTFTSLSLLSLPAAMALPAFSVICVAAAAFVALLAWLTPQRLAVGRLNIWDIVGALTLIGISAALLSDAEQAIPLLEARQTD
jgi:multidrug transporter EmrE-like cation transporter